MVVITCIVAADNGPKQYLEDVSATWWDLQKEDLDTDVILVSGQHQARVHRAILIRISPFLHGLVPSSCPCSTPAITLPKVQGDTLEALVELAYTGRSKVESKKGKEEFAELTKLLQIGLEVQYEEIISQEIEDPVIRANQVDEGETDNTDKMKRTGEKRGVDKTKKDEKKAAAAGKGKDEERVIADERKKIEEKTDLTKRKMEQKEKATSIQYKEAAVEKVNTEFITALGLNRNVEHKTASENKNEENRTAATKEIESKVLEEMPREAVNLMDKTEAKGTPHSLEMSKLVDKASSVKVGGSRQSRGRGRKSTVKETQKNPFLSPISHNRKTNSPDSILAKTTRNQKRKIQTILDVNGEIDATSETKKKRIALCIDKTEEPSRFVNIQDIIANNRIDTNLFDGNDVNENNNDLVQDPIKVNAANNSIEDPLENSQMSIMSDEGATLLLDGSKDDWDKETESKDKEAKFLCPFCQKEFQKKSRYDYHLSWNHFQDEIGDKFPGLVCAVCNKRFVKKSNYVSHLGSFHKVIDGLMAVAFNDKLAAIRESEQPKTFASPKHEGGDGVWIQTPKGKNASTPNKRWNNSSCNEPEESSEMANAATPAQTINENRQ